MTGLRLGLTGLVIRWRCACSGVRPPFLTLHFTQQQTMFSQLARPPWLLEPIGVWAAYKRRIEQSLRVGRAAIEQG